MGAMNSNDEMRNASGNVNSDDLLVCFLYLLARDKLPIGSIEDVLAETFASAGLTHHYTNGWLARWAFYNANKLKSMTP